jgi:phosphoglycolate phosphatase
VRPPRAVAFDLDGTLVASGLDIAAACNHVLVQSGRAPLDAAVIAGFVGDGARALLARAFGVPEDPLDPRMGAWHAQFVAYYSAHPATYSHWMPGAGDALSALSGLPLAVVTNKPRPITLKVLQALGAGARFAFVYAGGDGPLKPDPEPLLAVARALSVAAQDIWMVGDSDQDVRAARAAGAVAVAVRGGFAHADRVRLSSPEATLDSMAELPELVRSASAGAAN